MVEFGGDMGLMMESMNHNGDCLFEDVLKMLVWDIESSYFDISFDNNLCYLNRVLVRLSILKIQFFDFGNEGTQMHPIFEFRPVYCIHFEH